MNQSNSNLQTRQRRRRNKGQSHQRNFICNCGKTYLSYPALYTHIKNKHQGQAPSGQMPRISENRPIIQPREEIQSQTDRILSNPQQALVATINQFRAYSPSKELTYQINEIFEPFSIQLKKQIFQATKSCLEGKVPPQKLLDSGIKAVSIDQIIAKFLSLLMNKIDKKILQQFVFILLIFRKHINDHYLREGRGQYCKQGSGVKMLDTVNEFVLYYFDYYSKRYPVQFEDEACFIGIKKRQFIALGKFMFLFGRWVFLERFTNSKIKINNFG